MNRFIFSVCLLGFVFSCQSFMAERSQAARGLAQDLEKKHEVKGEALAALVSQEGKKVSLRGRVLDGGDLTGLNLQGADLQGARLKGYLENVNLQGADLRGANLTGARFLGSTNLQNANLQKAILRKVFMININLKNADMRGADLRSSWFILCSLFQADLRDARMWGAFMTSVDLKEARLDGADLQDMVFHAFGRRALVGHPLLEHALKVDSAYISNVWGVGLGGPELKGTTVSFQKKVANSPTDLSGANFRGAKLNGADLRGAKWNKALNMNTEDNVLIDKKSSSSYEDVSLSP